MISRKIVFQIPIDNLTFDQTLDKIVEFIDSGQPHQVATVNPEFLMEARLNPTFRSILQSTDLNVPDGIGLVWLAKLKQRVTGVDLVEAIAQKGDKLGWKIYLIGGQDRLAQKTAVILKNKYPGLKYIGAENPGSVVQLLKSPDIRLVNRIRAGRPDVMLVAFGAPWQEKFIAMYQKYLNVPVTIGVGGAFDFIAGQIPRAPSWLQAIGLEWLWRLARQPSRFKRIIRATIGFLLAYWFSNKK